MIRSFCPLQGKREEEKKRLHGPSGYSELFGLAGDDNCCVMYDSLFLQILLISVYLIIDLSRLFKSDLRDPPLE